MRKLFLHFILIFFIGNSVLAQIPPKYSTTSSKAIKYYESATKYFDARDNEKTISEAYKAIEKDPNFMEPYYLIADAYVDSRKLDKALELYERSFGVNPNYYPNAYYTAGAIAINMGQYEKCKLFLEKFLKFPNVNEVFKGTSEKYLLDCDFAIQAMRSPVPFNPINLEGAINTIDHEYFPSITADGKTFLFTRNLKDATAPAGYQEDFFVSKKNESGWQQALPIGTPINTLDNEGAPTISADGQILIFAACNRPDGAGSCDLYFSRKVGEKWTKPMNMGAPINTRNWETQPCFSSDGKTLYFVRGTVTREGIKNQDIYVCELKADGTWSTPLSLGATINSPEREESVFIHPDNQTLYFASNGHPGMGGMDIYVSRKLADGKWSTPINLGYPINTYSDENSLLVGPDGKLAYFASGREGGKGGLDLYQFELYDKIRPENLTYVKGKVFDSRTKKPVSALFELVDLSTSKIVLESESNMGNGEFLVCLTANKNYALNVSKNGYLFYSENFSLKDVMADISKPFQMDVPLQPIDTGMSVELKNVFFETGKFDLKPESVVELDKLVAFMNRNKNLKIEISGHTDNVGDKKANQQLSENRAKSVSEYLVKKAVDSTRIIYKGYGDAKPKVDNNSDSNRAKNRRTEFKIVSKM
ncbi:MAG: PD40 domain-containing protein [Bacteroidetes bacterium]|nr:PD40 domain-containing protein [Bacteroidota bacterium]